MPAPKTRMQIFARTNPGRAEGDMMLCLIPLTFDNWWGILSGAIRRGMRRMS